MSGSVNKGPVNKKPINKCLWAYSRAMPCMNGLGYLRTSIC